MFEKQARRLGKTLYQHLKAGIGEYAIEAALLQAADREKAEEIRTVLRGVKEAEVATAKILAWMAGED